MLEVKNLYKTYRSKNGVVTKALDGVSLTFPETGMIFILGKSGSGKSTLLNVCGGLDRADSGEIIIKGKSSNEFSGPDFDSYRNTYVGFVFQEYNVLDEFSVEENIALALELQNKKKSKEVIDKILSDVDMTNFAARKPNTLSGGQKQRVAIARALVKEPQIIMADEPTGALDSKTGQQVFDTLKKLSKDKLVLVISHDRDFAEQYADRIIELKDGKIISDQTRVQEDNDSKNIHFYGTDTVCVTNGAEITDDELEDIKKFLKRSGGSAVISTSRMHIAQMKEERPEINIGSFENIKEQPKPKAYDKQKLIHSHLPAKHAVKMGANGLKSKPVRLMFTILLSTIAFILFGLASTLMLFDGKKTTINTLMDSNDPYLILSKGYYGKYVSYVDDEIEYQDDDYSKLEAKYTIDEYKALCQKYPGAIATSEYSKRFESLRLGQYGGQYYTDMINKAILVNDSIEILYGVRPTHSDEIAISEYLYNAIVLSKTRFIGYDSKEIKITKPADLLYSATNKVTVNIDYKEFKVVGIFKTEKPSAEFDTLKQSAESNIQFVGNQKLTNQWSEYVSNSLLSSIMVTEDFLKKFTSSNQNEWLSVDRYFQNTDGNLRISSKNLDGWYVNLYYISKLEDNEHLNVYDLSGNLVQQLGNRAAALHAYKLGSLYATIYQNFVQDLNNSQVEQEKIQAIYNEKKIDFEKENLLIDKYFREDLFNNAVDYWQNQLEYEKNIAEQNGIPFDENAYRAENPYPNKTDKYDDYGDYKFYIADSEYFEALEKFRTSIFETSGTAAAYKKLLYEAQANAEKEFLKTNPKPIYPANGTGAEIDEYNKIYEQWNQQYWQMINETKNAVDPLYKLSYLSDLSLTREEILALFQQVDNLFDGLVEPELGFVNDYNPNLLDVSIAGIFFDNISTECAYLSDDMYDTYYVSFGQGNSYWSTYETKYQESKDAFIQSVFIPYNHNVDIVEQIVNLTYERAEDDSTAMILNSQMSQLSSFIELADTLGTAFLISGLVLALFAFLLMFNFISVSITIKKKEIGILRAIGARTLDVYKIFMSEALIISFICFALSTLGTLGICMLMNNILTKETFIVVRIFSFGPLSVLCILGVSLLTAIISTVIPVAIYSRKPPIESIRAL